VRKPRRSPPSTQISPNMGRQGLPSGFSCWLPATGAASADLRAAAGGDTLRPLCLATAAPPAPGVAERRARRRYLTCCV